MPRATCRQVVERRFLFWRYRSRCDCFVSMEERRADGAMRWSCEDGHSSRWHVKPAPPPAPPKPSELNQALTTIKVEGECCRDALNNVSDSVRKRIAEEGLPEADPNLINCGEGQRPTRADRAKRDEYNRRLARPAPPDGPPAGAAPLPPSTPPRPAGSPRCPNGCSVQQPTCALCGAPMVQG